jgi:RimJ/RimL family protein N-acetyltransferase
MDRGARAGPCPRTSIGGVLRPEYPIATGRLILRPYVESDLDDVFDIQSRPSVARYLYWGPRDRAQARESLARKSTETALTQAGDMISLAVVLPEAGTVIGDVILRWLSAEHRQGEVGYMFRPGFGGQGYATEAAAVMLRLGFDGLRLHRIIGRLDARNTASARLLERLGLRREAHFVQNEIVKGEWTDEVVYAMTEDEWRVAGAG